MRIKKIVSVGTPSVCDLELASTYAQDLIADLVGSRYISKHVGFALLCDVFLLIALDFTVGGRELLE